MHRSFFSVSFGAVLFSSAIACSHADTRDPGSSTAPAPAREVALATNNDKAPTAAVGEAPAEDEAPAPAFSDGARAFDKVRETLLKNYYAEGLTEDDAYRAATAGMLERLEPRMRKWNKLMTPREMSDIQNDLKGEVVGIGVHFQFDSKSGYADVLTSLPGSPADKAGLLAGDKIVTVNGKLYKGMRMKDVANDIRGRAGEPVTLTVLRGDKLITLDIARERVAYDQPTSTLLPGGLGYVSIPSFTDKTPGAVRAVLEDLEKKSAKSLVVDLRQCPGGSFDRAIETIQLFLPEGTPIVTLRRRGKTEETHRAKGKPVLANLPIAVLVDNGTTSGGEFMTGALREGRHARVIGEHTMGKWSVQSIDELPNGWAFKYTVSLFFTPSGKSFEGVGLSPDVEVKLDDQTLAKARAAKSPEERLTIDLPLRAARELMRAD